MRVGFAFILGVYATVVSAGCGETLIPGYTLSILERYQAQLLFTPDPPVPDRPLEVAAYLAKSDPEAADPTEVYLTATNEAGDKIELKLAEASPGIWTSEISFPSEGTYTYEILPVDAVGNDGVKGSVVVACPAEASLLGGSCCDDSDCASGECVVATCRDTKLGLGSFCLDNADCETLLCEESACIPQPTCDDEKQNAVETDVDCGGDTCGPCAEGQACAVPADCATDVCEEGVCGPPVGWLIGKGDGSAGSVTLKTISATGIPAPSDLAFNPNAPTELWITSPTADQLTVIQNPGKPEQQQVYFRDFSMHFLEQAISLSFSDDQTFGTCGNSDNSYDGLGDPNYFMGPALWPANTEDFYKYGPDAANVHLDMLHSSAFCMGIAAQGDGSKYFVFNGHDGVLDWYDFKAPHPDKKHGGEDHTDGVKRRYVEVSLKRAQNTPSHMLFDKASRWLYIADTGNRRIVRVNVDQATKGQMLQSFPFDGVLFAYQGVIQEDFVSADTNILQRPSGLALHEGILYVTDAQNGAIHAFDASGKIVRSLDTGLGPDALSGIAVGPSDGLIYLVDRAKQQVLRIDP